MLRLPKNTSIAPARTQIDIQAIQDGILVLKDNRYRAVLEVSSVNFELKSEDEQDALINSYESFLNSLPCTVQYLIRTRELDIDNYVEDLSARLRSEADAIYRGQFNSYVAFIKKLVTSKKIWTRRFYVVIPLDSGATKITLASVAEYLDGTVDIVTKGLARVGMQSRRLQSGEIIDLFYSFYSPQQAKTQPISAQLLRARYNDMVLREPV